jgi:hypothetical protein
MKPQRRSAKSARGTTSKGRLPFPATLLLCFALSQSLVLPGFAQEIREKGQSNRISAKPRQLISLDFEGPDLLKRAVTVSNTTDQPGDVDLVLFGWDGQELVRETVTLEPNSKNLLNVLSYFGDLDLMQIQAVHIQVTLREEPQGAQTGVTLPIAFFSQRNPTWSGNQLGTCTKSGVKQTIGMIGCALTSFSMAGANSMTNSNPGDINRWLTGMRYYGIGGYPYAGLCNMQWDKAALYDGQYGFGFRGLGTVTSAANLKSLLDRGYYIVTKSRRFAEHWVVIYKYRNAGTALSDFEYLDPWDASYQYRTLADNDWVRTTSETRLFR